MRSPAVLGLLGCLPASGFVAVPFARFVGTTAWLTRVQPRSVTTAESLRMAAAGDGDRKSPWEAFTIDKAKAFATNKAKKAAVAAVVAAVAFSAPGDALAAGSGGRMGGSSFSSSSSYSTQPYVRDYGYGQTEIRDRTDVVLFCSAMGVTYGVDYGVTELAKRMGTRFGNLDDSPPSSLGEGVDVLKLQVAITCRDRGSDSILGVLADVSARGDTESRSGLAEVVSEISLALVRRSSDWVASANELEHFNNRNAKRAEATFSQYSVQLRAKVERETNAIVGGKDISVERSGEGRSALPGGPTVAVVSLVIALRGDAVKRLGLDKSISMSGLKVALRTIASGSLSDDGGNLLAAEVLWTPEEPWEVFSREDAIADFPELVDL